MLPTRVLRDSFTILTLISLGLTFWRWVLHLRFPLHGRVERGGSAGASPYQGSGVTVLKPLKGCDAETKACLRSWFEQDYAGPVQLLFGVADAEDPACEVVRELIAAFPKADAQLAVCPKALGANGKVSTLQQLEPLVKHPILMVSDADARVGRDFIDSVGRLCVPGVGLVNCLYRLANPTTRAMEWEAIAINADFWTHVLQAASLGRMDFALGAVMTLPAPALAGIGGFAALADYLADDYQLGRRIAANGGRIVLAPAVVDCWEAPMGWAAVWRHQLRWARTIRVCQPASFFLSVINNSSVWPVGLLALSIRGPGWAVGLGLGALAFRVLTAQQQLARMNQRAAAGVWWLAPLKDVLDVVIWAAALWGAGIEWRGERYRVERGGKLARISSRRG